METSDRNTFPFAEFLLNLLSQNCSLQSMVDRVEPYFSNPILVFEATFKIMAATWAELDKSAFCRHLLEDGGFSDEDFQVLNGPDHLHERIRKSPHPVAVSLFDDGNQLVVPISSDENLGHIVLLDRNHPFSEEDSKRLDLLRMALGQLIKKESFVRSNRGLQKEYFIRDLLDENSTPDSLRLAQVHHFANEFNGTLYCAVAEAAISSSSLNVLHIRRLLEETFPHSMTLLLDSLIVCLIILPEDSHFSSENRAALSGIVSRYALKCGLSNEFHDVLDLRLYRAQAEFAMRCNPSVHGKNSLSVFGDCYLSQVKELLSRQIRIDTLFCPSLLRLNDYDRLHKTNFAFLLYLFFRNDQNIVATANEAGIHRNTLSYQIKKIEALAGLDFSNADERFYYMFSYLLGVS